VRAGRLPPRKTRAIKFVCSQVPHGRYLQREDQGSYRQKKISRRVQHIQFLIVIGRRGWALVVQEVSCIERGVNRLKSKGSLPVIETIR
jgi:hypothetical protein